MSMAVLLIAGAVPTITVGLGGTQGFVVMGMHGTGVGTPKAAAVAAINIGFPGEIHIPKGKTLRKGLESSIFAPGPITHMYLLIGKTIRGLGALPKIQRRRAVWMVCIDIV
jgi:hypothetical protein